MRTAARDLSQSSLRDEHTAHTRQRLLQAAIDVIVEDGADELSLRDVARKAGVSAPTAYRHFATRAALLEATVAFIDERMHIPARIDTVEEFVAALPAIHQSFSDNERFLRAYLRAQAAADLRRAGRKNRASRVGSAVRRSLPRLTEAELRAFAPLLQLYASSSTWDMWSDLWGLDGERAGRVAAWATQALYESIRRDPAGFARACAASPATATAAASPPRRSNAKERRS